MSLKADVKVRGKIEEIEFFDTGEEIERICFHDSYNIFEGWDSFNQRWTCSVYMCDGQEIEIPDDPEFECEELNKRKLLNKC